MRVLSILLVAAMLAAALCSGGSVESATLPSPDQFGGRRPGVIALGAILPLNGKYAAYGKHVQKGIDLAAFEVNRSGGLLGRKLSVIYRNDCGTRRGAISAFNDLAGRVPAIVGPLLSANATAIAPLAQKKHTIVMSPSATSPELSGSSPYFFRTVGSDVFQGKALSDSILDVQSLGLGVPDIAVLYVDNAYGTGLSSEFLKRYPAAHVRAALSFAEGAGDMRTQLGTIKALGVQIVVLIAYWQDAGTVLQQAGKMNMALIWAASDGTKTDQILKDAHSFGDNYVMATFPMTMVAGDATDTFCRLYRKLYGRESPDSYAAYGYDTLMVLVEAIRQQGDDTSTGMLDALHHVRYSGVTGMKTFDARGDCPAGYDIWELRKASWAVIARLVP